jgi:hypothetical protein
VEKVADTGEESWAYEALINGFLAKFWLKAFLLDIWLEY